MIRISTSATARWTKQCASSGSAQPVFWSLPIAIQEFCSTKSAMTCLNVRTSIHPISAPTGTEDDIAGNDKLTPFAETGRKIKLCNRESGCQHNIFSKRKIADGIYDTSPA